jgi:hypothetical protein
MMANAGTPSLRQKDQHELGAGEHDDRQLIIGRNLAVAGVSGKDQDL